MLLLSKKAILVGEDNPLTIDSTFRVVSLIIDGCASAYFIAPRTKRRAKAKKVKRREVFNKLRLIMRIILWHLNINM
jgi:hypothetical protein